MKQTRESLYAAIFAKFAGLTFVSGGATAFGITSRKLLHFDNIQKEQFPCLFQVQATEKVHQVRGLPPKWTLEILLEIDVNTDAQQDSSIIPSQLLNPILDAIDAALKIDDLRTGACTLGGLVSHAYISGPIQTSEGTLGNLEMAVVPVEIVVPS